MSRSAFTLIELLVVIAILAILLTLCLPMLGLADRLSRTSATRTVMAKTETALRLFRSEIGAYPWQQAEDQPDAGGWSNRLHYHLGSMVDAGDWGRVRSDAAAAAALYRYEIGKPFPSKHAFRAADGNIDDKGNLSPAEGGRAMMLNRMAAERARTAILGGHYRVPGCALPVPWSTADSAGNTTTVVRRVIEDPADPQPLLAAPASAARPGWAQDYLRGELERRYVDGQRILDGWGRPLIYIGQIIEGTTAAPVLALAGMRTQDTRAVEFGLQPIGRFSLAPFDAITGLPIATAPLHRPAYLPDPADLRRSDRRRYAAPGCELDIELWSAGPDGRWQWLRDDPANADSVSLVPYDRTIP